MTINFKIPYPDSKAGKTSWSKRYSLNAYYSGKPWRARSNDKQYWHTLVRFELNRQRVSLRTIQNPVRITMYWNDGLDIDNHTVIGKMIVDALKGTILKDDTRRYFKAIAHEFHDEPYILVKIEEQV